MKRLVSLLLLLSLAAGCSRPVPPQASPDGSLILAASIERSRAAGSKYLCVILEIRDRAGKVLFRENTGASDVMKWNLHWESNTRIKLDSSDIGTYYWNRQPDGSWRKE
jgi:hypothetical protein